MAEFGVNVCEIPEADESRLTMDKENVFYQKSTEMNQGACCRRTPLQNINQGRDRVSRPIYSPVTPVLGTRSRTPHSGQKSKTPHNRRKTVCGIHRKPSPLNLMNTLLYNKAKELIKQGLQEEKDRRKELEALLGEKDEEILRLKVEVGLLGSRPVDTPILQDTHILQDDRSVTTSCKLSSVDNSKRTKHELATELEASEINNRTLCSELVSLHQKCQLLEQELVQMRMVMAEGGTRADIALEQAKVSYEQRIAELLTHPSQQEKEDASCRIELQQREKEVMMLNESLAKSRDDLALIYKQKGQETESCNEYRSQHQTDVERLEEVKAQLEEFAKIRPNIIKARLAQANLATVIRKAHETVLEKNRSLNAEREEFLKLKVEWLHWKDEKEESLAAAEKGKQRQEKSVQRHLTEQLESAESRIDDLLKRIVCLEASLEEEKGIKHDLTEKLNLAEKQATGLNEQMAADIERRGLEVTNLLRTLDMREHETDELTKECNSYKKLVQHMKARVTKQQSIISKVNDLETQIGLLEKEKMAVCDEMLELRRKSTESQQKLQQLTADHNALKDELQLQTEKAQSLEVCLLEKDQEILSKDAELSNAVNAVELLFKRASSFFDKLTSQWRAWNNIGLQQTLTMSQGVNQAEAGTPHRRRSQARTPVIRTPVTSARRRSRKSFGAPSFVFQILSASKQYRDGTNAEPRESTAVPVLKMYESTSEGKSAQDHAVIGHNELDATLEPESEKPQLAIRRSSQDSACSDGADVVSLHSTSSTSHGERFTNFVHDIATITAKMEALLQGEVAVAFSQLKTLVKNLKNRLSQQQQTHAEKLKEAQLVVSQAVAEAAEAQRKSQIAIQRSTNLEDDLKEKTENLNQLTALLQDKNENLIQLMDQSFEIQKLSVELTSALKRCELSNEENRLLRVSFDERLQRIEKNPENRIAIFKEMEEEIISLKLQKQKLMQEYVDGRRKWNESIFPLEEQHRIDVRNIRKAEEAIGQLDEKIERVRLALLPHKNYLKTDEKLHQILREIRVFD